MATRTEWVRCPESSCDEDDAVVDYYHDGEQTFLSFSCLGCGHGSLEDDIRFWVKCPDCHDEPDEIYSVDSVEGNASTDGLISFECLECGCSAEFYPDSRWDAEDKEPFEPHPF